LQLRGRLREDKSGVGTLIAAVFIIMIVMTGYSLSLLTSNKNQEYYNTLREMANLDYDRSRENISIMDVQITTGLRLNVTAKNNGPEMARIIWIGLFDQTQYPEKDAYTSVSYSLSPGELLAGMGSSISVLWGKNYVVQIVTERGNEIDRTFYPAKSIKCKLDLLALPSSIYAGENITVLLIITHNQTQPDSIQNVTAKLTVNPSGSVQLMRGPQQLFVLGLNSGSSAFFKWIYNATQAGTIYFNASYIDAPQGTYAISQIKVKLPPGGKVEITGPSQIQRNTWTNYTIRAFAEDGNTVPYAWITVGASNTKVSIKAVGETGGGKNPVTYSVDLNGQLVVQVSSNTPGGTTFTLYVNFGTTYTSKSVIQLP